MKRLCFIILFLSYLLLSHAETFVVCVGIGNYKNPNIQSLTKTENDAKSIASFYKQGTENVIIITGKYATKTRILGSLKSQFGRAKKGDKIVFFFSGHGYPGGFCPYEMSSLHQGLTYSEVVDLMNKSNASDKIIFADACNSGAIRGEESGKAPNVGNIMFFLSSRGNENSRESPFLANGYFTKNLLRGLRGAADYNKDMIITAHEIFEYVSKETASDTQNRQHPVMWGNFPDNMVIVKYNKR